MTINRTQRAWLIGLLAPGLVGMLISACGSSGGGNTTSGAGGTSSTGGTTATGGTTGHGGTTGTGGTIGTGGVSATGGTTGTGGTTATGGTTGAAGHGGTTGAGGATGAAGRGGTTGMAGTTGAGGSGSCPHVQLTANNICTIGDSWLAIPGSQVTTLENHMIAAGLIASGSHFDRREVSGSTLSSIVKTYTNKPSNCKILVMDGGGIDLFTTPLDPTAAAVTNIVNMFKTFLQTVKSDGYVQGIVYSLYPVIPSTKNLNGNMKPGFSAACAASAVPCTLVDLEPLFNGQHFGSDNTHPDATGATIIGDAWWKAMQQSCIGQ